MDPFKSSRYRFLDSQPFTFECKYTDISLPSSNVDQVVVRTNGELFALPINSPTGQLYIRPVKGSERFTHKVSRLVCHRHAVSSFSFDPFNSSYLMTGAEDGEIRLWKIPKEGITSNENEPVLSLEGHRRKILNMEYNPVAPGIIATGSSDGSCKIWNVFSKRELMSMELQGPQLQEMKWDYTGSLLCTGTKNREYQIWDPRTVNVITSWVGHASPRRSYMTWLGDSYYLVTTGYSKQSNREVCLRDIRNINSIVYTITADNSPGPFIPFYNPCCHILWYSGRGDAKLNGIDVDDVSMWTNREGGNCININMKTSVKSLAILPQHLLDIKRNEVDKFVRINMECGVDGFDVVLPHQAGAAITEIYGRLPVPSPAITEDAWLKGAIEKPITKEIPANNAKRGGLSSGKAPSEAAQLKFIKPADMKAYIIQSRVTAFSQDELDSFKQNLSSLADIIKSPDADASSVKSSDTGSLTRSLNISTLRRGTELPRARSGSTTSIKTTNGVSRRTSVIKVSEKAPALLKKGSAVAQLEQSHNRLCLNLNRQKKDPVSTSSEVQRAQPAPSTSRGYRVSDVIHQEKPAPAPASIPTPPTPVPAPAHNLSEIRKSQNQNMPITRPATIPSLSPLSSASTTPASNVTPTSSRGPSLSDIHMRPNAAKLVFPENRNSFNRNNADMEKEFAKINAKLDSLESRYDDILKKLDYLIKLSEKRYFVC